MKKYLHIALLISGLVLALDIDLLAQGKDDFATLAPDSASKKLNEKLQSNNATSNTGTLSNLPSISLTSIFSDTQAEAKFSIVSGKSMFNVALSQAFSEKPKTATFLDIEGITTGTTFSVGWQKTIGRTPIPKKLPIKNMARFNAVKEKARARKGIDAATDVTYLDMNEAEKKELIEGGALDLDAFASPLIFTARVSASRVAFNYIPDSLALKPSEATRVGKNFNVAISKFMSLDTYFSLSYSFVINYSSGSDVLNYNFPVGNAGHSFSSEVTFGEPAGANDSRIKGEFRQLIRRNFVPILGVNPSVTWIVGSEKMNIDLPVYFITKREDGEFNGLQAGLKLGYTSRFDDRFLSDIVNLKSQKVYFGLFVTKPFSVR
ncbi:hypothetical protein [Dyadobacter sp. Leaf189]|uniref:hypothetical protein n=1 Tax=Dyadobacter sp. Leaf189 TaxID=1736295 RepID=UPI0006FE3471|nr:hypothetical protein [Dyadobacter sp. Leaf189]KQS31030.1 hypothetical protein ASG33_11765 [Dyadobacter sp. Leaf189]